MSEINKKICIFCRLEKEKFTNEHIFSAAIGGAFEITTVCETCNKTLGDNIDNPLVRHERILLHRHNFQIRREGKSGTRNNIPNPFPGKHKDEDGNDYIVIFNSEGKPESRIIPKYHEPIKVENGVMMTYTIPLEDFKDEEIIKKRVSKKMGIDPDKIVIKDIQENPTKPIEIKILAPNNPLILGALKVVYEFGATFIPQFLKDPISLEYSKILLTQTIEDEQKIYFNEDLEERVKIAKRVAHMQGMQTYHHIAMLTTLKGKGLFCFVKIFDFGYLIKLSESDQYELKNELWLFNDAIQQTWNMNIATKLTHFNLYLDLGKIDSELQRTIMHLGQNSFKDKKGNISVYNENKKIVFENLTQSSKSLGAILTHLDLENKQMHIEADFSNQKFYLKHTKQEHYVPLTSLTYLYKLEY